MKTVQSKGAGSPEASERQNVEVRKSSGEVQSRIPDLGKGTGWALAPGCSLPSLSTASFPREPLPPPKIEHLPSHNYTETAETKVQAPESSSKPLVSPATAF